MMRAFLVTSVLTAIIAARAPAQNLAQQLRARVTSFAHDSMLGRMAATPGHTKATRYLASYLDALRAAGLLPMGDSASWTQSVPLVSVQIDSAKTRLTGFKRPRADHITYPVDFLPMSAALGFPPRVDAKFEFAKIVRGGTLGDPRAIKPDEVRGKIVLFLPPMRPDGGPDYQLWAYTDLLAKYRNAAAVFVESLELMPRSTVARIREPWLELPQQPGSKIPLPPVIAVSRAAAVLLEDQRDPVIPGKVSYSVSLRREATTLPSQNVVAMLPGSDATLSREIIVLSANATNVFGSMSLLAIAEAVAASPVKPLRSIAFLWTIGGERGELGWTWFSQHPRFKLDQVVARIDVDAHVECASEQDAGMERVDFARYASATQSLGALVVELANTTHRSGFELPVLCAR